MCSSSSSSSCLSVTAGSWRRRRSCCWHAAGDAGMRSPAAALLLPPAKHCLVTLSERTYRICDCIPRSSSSSSSSSLSSSSSSSATAAAHRFFSFLLHIHSHLCLPSPPCSLPTLKDVTDVFAEGEEVGGEEEEESHQTHPSFSLLSMTLPNLTLCVLLPHHHLLLLHRLFLLFSSCFLV